MYEPMMDFASQSPRLVSLDKLPLSCLVLNALPTPRTLSSPQPVHAPTASTLAPASAARAWAPSTQLWFFLSLPSSQIQGLVHLPSLLLHGSQGTFAGPEYADIPANVGGFWYSVSVCLDPPLACCAFLLLHRLHPTSVLFPPSRASPSPAPSTPPRAFFPPPLHTVHSIPALSSPSPPSSHPLCAPIGLLLFSVSALKIHFSFIVAPPSLLLPTLLRVCVLARSIATLQSHATFRFDGTRLASRISAPSPPPLFLDSFPVRPISRPLTSVSPTHSAALYPSYPSILPFYVPRINILFHSFFHPLVPPHPRPQSRSSCRLECKQALANILASVRVTPIELMYGEGTRVAWRVYLLSPTNNVAHHTAIRNGFARIAFITFFSVGSVRADIHCRLCTSVDHPATLCPLLVPGWMGATPTTLPALPVNTAPGRGHGHGNGRARGRGRGAGRGRGLRGF
ncbi:hypothetical protein B0H17DRAFT_1219326 [Mycena rosella]|uniref:Uncharacterized protein n=1 Tax=Mycena rosella TaxID=1033263 RepID=A0AAD7FFV0_MYCRO|nr:hypothetical protein B0H17DRAFT_1219326 [Mycena rosella]